MIRVLLMGSLAALVTVGVSTPAFGICYTEEDRERGMGGSTYEDCRAERDPKPWGKRSPSPSPSPEPPPVAGGGGPVAGNPPRSPAITSTGRNLGCVPGAADCRCADNPGGLVVCGQTDPFTQMQLAMMGNVGDSLEVASRTLNNASDLGSESRASDQDGAFGGGSRSSGGGAGAGAGSSGSALSGLTASGSGTAGTSGIGSENGAAGSKAGSQAGLTGSAYGGAGSGGARGSASGFGGAGSFGSDGGESGGLLEFGARGLSSAAFDPDDSETWSDEEKERRRLGALGMSVDEYASLIGREEQLFKRVEIRYDKIERRNRARAY